MKSSKSSPEPRMANGLKPIQVVLSKPVLPSFIPLWAEEFIRIIIDWTWTVVSEFIYE